METAWEFDDDSGNGCDVDVGSGLKNHAAAAVTTLATPKGVADEKRPDAVVHRHSRNEAGVRTVHSAASAVAQVDAGQVDVDQSLVDNREQKVCKN